MSIAADVATLLRAESTVTGAVTNKTVRVYAGAAPERDLTKNKPIKPPYIEVANLTTDFFNTIEGTGAVATGRRKATLDIDCKGQTEVEADTVKAAVAAYFDDYSGAAGNSTIAAVDLTDCGDDFENPEHGEGLPTFVKTLEAEVIYS